MHLTRRGKLVADTFKLDRKSSIRGKALGPDGKPLANLPLFFDFFNNQRAVINSRRLQTDSNGRFELQDLPAGELFVRFERYRGDKLDELVQTPAKFFVAHVHAADGQEFDDVTVDLSQCNSVLEGQLIDAKGNGITDAEIRVNLAFSFRRLDHSVETKTDGQGRFRITGLPPNEFVVSARKPFATGLGDSVTVQLKSDDSTSVRLLGYTAGHIPPKNWNVEPQWGPTHNGLQAAVAIEPQKEQYSVGEVIDVKIIVRNVSNSPMEFDDTLSFDRLNISGLDQYSRSLDFRHFTGWPFTVKYRLEPGHEVLLKGSFDIELKEEGDNKASRAMFALDVVPGENYRMSVGFGRSFTDLGNEWHSGDSALRMAPPDDAAERKKRSLTNE